MILVTILGDCHSSFLPINFEFKTKITKHVFVHDDSKYDLKYIKKVLNGQRDFLDEYSIFSNVEYEIVTLKVDEDSYESIIKCYDEITTLAKNQNDIYLNATDGLNSISIVLVSKFLKQGANIIVYDRYSNTYNLHTKNSMKKYDIKYNLDIKNHLRLKGYKLVEYADKSVVESRKKVILKLMEDSYKYKNFVNQLQNKNIRDIVGFDSYIELLKSINKLDNITYIQGSVFEEYIYHIIKDTFDFDDVMLGVKVEFEEYFENESDILMIKNNHLHTIECKFVNQLKGEHYIYKTNSIIDYLDDDGKAMILSIGGDNEIKLPSGKKKAQFTRGDRARADNGNIKIHQSKIFDKNKFINDIQKWFCQ